MRCTDRSRPHGLVAGARRFLPSPGTAPAATAALLVALLTTATSGRGQSGSVPEPATDTAAPRATEGANGASPQRLYVCNQADATVTIIDMSSQEILDTIDLAALGFSSNAKPHHVAVEKDGSHWYLSLIGAGRVLKFTVDNQLVGEAEFETPGMLALHPTEDLLFVGRSMSAVNPPPSIGVIRPSDMSIDEIDVLFPRRHAIAVSPDGKHVYAASLAVNQIAVMDTESESVEVQSVEGPTHTIVQFAVAPDGSTLVGTGELTGLLLVFGLEDPAHPEHRQSIEVGKRPWHPVFGDESAVVYVPNKESNTVSVVDLELGLDEADIGGPGLAQPHGSALSRDGRFLFVSNNNTRDTHGMEEHAGAGHDANPVGSVVVIDTEELSIVKVIEVGHNPTGLSAAP